MLNILAEYIYMYYRGQKALDPLKLELWMVMTYHTGVGNSILNKKNKSS